MDKVLIIDDDSDLRRIVRDVLREEGFRTEEAHDGPSGLKAFENVKPDAVLLDLRMPSMHGFEVLRELLAKDPGIPVIILTAYGDIPTAVEAIRNGAYDFTIKPPEFEKLVITLRRAVEKRTLEFEVNRMDNALEFSLEEMLGRSSGMKTVIDQIRQIAPTDLSLIIQGETGTGKSVIAGAVRNFSNRVNGPYVRVDIGLVPDTLIESELFGYKKGAFTGADRDKPGYFEAARGGTIFLDELENMSLNMQGKLLNVIEQRKIYPLGSTEAVDLNARILGATNSDIRQSVTRKEFREDLYYRLGEFIITLPPLRERTEDIPFFAEKFLADASSELKRQMRGISDEAFESMIQYSWPGNLRELRNVVRRAVLMQSGDVVERETVQIMIHGGGENADPDFLPLKQELKELEKKKIQEALLITKGNKTRASEILQISYKSLWEKIKEYGLE